VRGDTIVLDFNHPLAGETLHFQVKVIDLRPATAEELDHGHVHGEGHGHHE
jgi:FKBP-type peptidyl-prolyl cis-trans isomerase SlyD